jgi:very-short-patch-repair endonuclease
MLRYKAQLKHKARQLRKNMTDSECVLWFRLRGKQLSGVQFYRQKPIGEYIVDFYAPTPKLVIEVDGSQHLESEQAEKDWHRDEYMATVGLRVLRFNSREVLEETDEVVEVIYRAIAERLYRENPPRSPFKKGGRF